MKKNEINQITGAKGNEPRSITVVNPVAIRPMGFRYFFQSFETEMNVWCGKKRSFSRHAESEWHSLGLTEFVAIACR